MSNITALCPFRPARQHQQRLWIWFGEVHAVARAEVDTHLHDTPANAVVIAEISELRTFEGDQNLAPSPQITKVGEKARDRKRSVR